MIPGEQLFRVINAFAVCTAANAVSPFINLLIDLDFKTPPVGVVLSLVFYLGLCMVASTFSINEDGSW